MYSHADVGNNTEKSLALLSGLTLILTPWKTIVQCHNEDID